MTPSLVTYLVTAKRTEKRKLKQQIVAIQQTVADAVQENKAELVQSY